MTLLSILAAIQFPILERIPLFGDAAVSPHGLGIAIGFGLGAVLMIKRAQKRGLGHVHEANISEAIQEMLTRSAVGAILGARGFYVLTHLSDFEGRWHETLYAWQGGLTFLGGVAGAIGLAVPFARKKGWRMDMLLDSAAPGMALGLAVGRIGDLIIGDHIGAPTDFPLAWKCTGNFWVRATNSFGSVDPLPYPSGGAPTAGCFDVAVHHTALYDFGAALIVLLVLLAMERKRWFDGAFISAWVFIYGALRFTSDFARQDKTWFGLTGSQWALVGAATAVALWLLRNKPWKREDWAWDLAFDHPWKNPAYNAETGRIPGPQSSHVAVTAGPGVADPDAPASSETDDTDLPTSASASASEAEPSESAIDSPTTVEPSVPEPGETLFGDRRELGHHGTEAPDVDADSPPPAAAAQEAPFVAPARLESSDAIETSEPGESVEESESGESVEQPVTPEAAPTVDAPDTAATDTAATTEPLEPAAPSQPSVPSGLDALGVGPEANVTRSTSTQPKMATRPRRPRGTSGT